MYEEQLQELHERRHLMNPFFCDTLIKIAIKDHLSGNLPFYCLTEIVFDTLGFYDGRIFTSFTGNIKARVIANEYLIYCIICT